MRDDAEANEEVTPPLASAEDEARRVLELAELMDIPLRVLGGIAVRLHCPSATLPPLRRAYNDIDYAARRHDRGRITKLFEMAGYSAESQFNVVNGENRLFFRDTRHDRDADVFLDAVTMCHHLDFHDRLELQQETLPIADLLLLKLQVVEINEKDFIDALALIVDHPINERGIDATRIASVLATDWGWWRTATHTLERVAAYADGLLGAEQTSLVKERIALIRQEIDEAPKSRRWRLRAKVGERVSWYDIPEESHL